jgi:predicted RNA-binding Zn-ribbon protein involved in translation (DUF1610 family)
MNIGDQYQGKNINPIVPQQIISIIMFELKDSPFIVMGDLWRISAAAIQLDEEALFGVPGISCNIETIPDNIDDTIVAKVHQALDAMCLPKSPDIHYTTHYDERTKWRWGVAYALRPTSLGRTEAARHKGVVLRCAMCGQTSKYGVSRSRGFINKTLSYYLCEDCDRKNSSSLGGTESVITCWCGYRFLSGWAEWYYKEKNAAKCPNCGILIAGSGATMTEGLGQVSSL